MDSRDKLIEELRALIAEQAARIQELELDLAKAKKDSSTSSKPPSSDIAKPKPKKSTRGKSRKGGQPGHQRQLRQPLPPDRVDEVIEIDDDEVERLGPTLTGEFEIVQQRLRAALDQVPGFREEREIFPHEDRSRPHR